MGGACGKGQGQLVYRSGLTPKEFYEQKLEMQLAETYEVFGLSEAQGKRFFDYFVAIDADGGGTVDQEEFTDDRERSGNPRFELDFVAFVGVDSI